MGLQIIHQAWRMLWDYLVKCTQRKYSSCMNKITSNVFNFIQTRWLVRNGVHTKLPCKSVVINNNSTVHGVNYILPWWSLGKLAQWTPLRTIRAYWSKRRVVPPVLFRTNYYSIEILHGVTAIILTYHPHHAKLQVLPNTTDVVVVTP